jgi:hypothetical protein
MFRAGAFRSLRILAIWSLLSLEAGRLLPAWPDYHAENFDHHQAETKSYPIRGAAASGRSVPPLMVRSRSVSMAACPAGCSDRERSRRQLSVT